jgi:hypothetical protein
LGVAGVAGVDAFPTADLVCLGADGWAEARAGVAFVDFAGVFDAGGVLSDLAVFVGPDCESGSDAAVERG